MNMLTDANIYASIVNLTLINHGGSVSQICCLA